jgi:hypothetical protein
MPHCNPRRRTHQIECLREHFAQADGLPFANVLSRQRIEDALLEERVWWRKSVYTPVLTLWAFLTQVLSSDRSCRAAVNRVLFWLVATGQTPCSPQTDPYCKARQRLPESLLQRLLRQTGQSLHQDARVEWRWKGRRVKIADGTIVSMPDTPANQEAYPQSRSQKPGVGFPLARLVVVFCLGCGVVLDAALGPFKGKKTGENSLLRSLLDVLTGDDILLGDHVFGGYFDLALLHQRGVDAVVPRHQKRRSDFRSGRRLGSGDHIVVWTKPARPAWMDEATYTALPATLRLREVAVPVRQRGFRTQRLIVVTTLLDAAHYTAADLAALYRARWHAELDLRCLKVTLGMDVLRCKSPEMVRKEVWAHLLAYNLIRSVMAEAANDLGVSPRLLSFAGACQAVLAFAAQIHSADAATAEDLWTWLLLVIVSHRVGHRPDRFEPRKRKRRQKHYPLLNEPRADARNALLN